VSACQHGHMVRSAWWRNEQIRAPANRALSGVMRGRPAGLTEWLAYGASDRTV
jgi:hypothetical protein